jgi:redox-sensitive bicupin YhaK (pirin superfamily)
MRLKPSRTEPAEGPALQRLLGRSSALGPGLEVLRALPHPMRRTVGPWCFLDRFGPVPTGSMAVAPHPHCGLSTVTWLLEGDILHQDSLGSKASIRPGQLNWMTSGRGISHSEQASALSPMHGVQLWVALPEAHRDVPPAFHHHAALPRVQDGLGVTVLVGDYQGARSPAVSFSPTVALEISLPPGASAPLPLDPEHEHALLLLSGAARVEGEPLDEPELLYLGRQRREVRLESGSGARLLLVGGEPLEHPLLVWWNFVVRDEDELRAAIRSWNDDDGRFGTSAGPGERLLSPELS